MDDAALEFAEVEAVDPAIARAERRLRLLEELTEIGMSLARGLRDEAAGIAVGEKSDRDPADVYAPLSRAIRLTIALEARTDQELRDLKAGIVREREEKRVKVSERAKESVEAKEKDTAEASEERVRTARSLVEAICDAEASDYEDYHGLTEALEERLEGDIAYAYCHEWPLRQIVEHLCKDLGLDPDWSHWTGEGWDEHYTFERHRWDEFNRPSRRPVNWAYTPPGIDPPETRERPRKLE